MSSSSMTEPAFVRLVRAGRLAWLRRARRRERSCVRCGAEADGVCPACGARVCADCSVLSIETGAPVALCLSCSGTSPAHGPGRRLRVRPWELFRLGASLLLLLLLAAAAVALERHGWPGVWRVLLAALHPAVVLGLVPLALVLGALATGVRKILFRSLDR